MKILPLSLFLASLAALSCRPAAPDPASPTQPARDDHASGGDSRSYYQRLNDPARNHDRFTDTDLIYD